MDSLLSLIKRFQALKEVTGTSKSSSYSVQLHFDPWSDRVQVEFGGYDVGDEEKLNSLRWEFFLSQCAIPWDDLSEESKDFFCEMGSIESSAEDINNAVDAAILKDEKK